MALVPTGHIKTIDDARRAIQKLASNKLGPNASPTYYGLTLTTPLIVPNGGTGLATLTDHGILLGSGTGAITPLAEATDGQIPIGDTDADPVLATITGTTNRVTVSNAAGSITLSGPQDIHTLATPTFARETLTDTCLIAGGANFLRVTGLQTDGTAMTGILRGAYIDVSNGNTVATGTIRGMELRTRTEAPDDIGNNVTVLEGLSISADSKGHSVTTMRAAEFILDGKTGGTITEAVGLRIANNLQANKATTSYGLQIYRDSFDYTYDITLSKGGHITGDSYINQDVRTTGSPAFVALTVDTDTLIVDAVNHRVGIGLNPNRKLDVFSDTDIACSFGRAKIGYDGVNADYANFAHFDHLSTTAYAIRQGPNGYTMVNSASGKYVSLRAGNTEQARIYATSIRIGNPSSNYSLFGDNGDLSFVGTSGFYPRRISQADVPGAGTGATQIDTGELLIWRDSDDGKIYLVYNDTTSGIKKVELP